MRIPFKWTWTVPNVLSLFRMALIPVFVVLYCHGDMQGERLVYLYWALGVLALSALTDLLDGWIARRFDQISDVGKLLDPLADKLTQIAVLLSVTLHRADLWWLLVACVTKETLQLIGGYLLLSRHDTVEGAHWYGKVTTALFYVTMAFIVVSDYWLTAYSSVTSIITAVLLVLLIAFMMCAFIGYLRLFFTLKEKNGADEEKE